MALFLKAGVKGHLLQSTLMACSGNQLLNIFIALVEGHMLYDLVQFSMNEYTHVYTCV